MYIWWQKNHLKNSPIFDSNINNDLIDFNSGDKSLNALSQPELHRIKAAVIWYNNYHMTLHGIGW